MSESDMIAALRTRHPSRMGEWVFLAGVNDRTGGSTRQCDALAMNLWESRGLALHGYEVKCSRSDWLTELRNPAKADRFWRWCRYWTLAVPAADLTPKGRGAESVKWERQTIVAEDELPEGWGLAVWSGKKWHNPVKAKSHPTEDIPRRLVAAMLRRAVQGSALEAELSEARARGIQEGRESAARGDRSRKALEEAQGTLRAFQEGVGVPLRDFLDRWASRWANVPVEERLKALDTVLAGPVMDHVARERFTRLDNLAKALQRDVRKAATLADIDLGED